MTATLNTSEPEPVSQRVVTAVAEATDTDPLDLEPLYTYVDPDSLNAIFDGGPGGGRTLGEVSFPMAGCRVVVSADGTVDVTDREATAESTSSREGPPPVLDAAGTLD